MAVERRQLQAAAPRPLTLDQQRELAALVDRYFDGPDADGVDLADAVVRWIFERGDLLLVPASPAAAAEGLRYVVTTPWGQVAPVYVAAPGAVLGDHRRTPRRPSLRDLGAETIER